MLPTGGPLDGRGSGGTTRPGAGRRRAHRASLVLPPLVLAGALAAGGHGPAAPDAAARAAAAVEAGRAHAWLTDLQARAPNRVVGSPRGATAAAFVASSLRAAGLPAEERVLERAVRGRPLVNVVSRLPGADRTREVVLVAHLDTVAAAPGALDNGSGAAALLEAGRAVAALEERPATDVVLLWADGEEAGLLGTKDHLEALEAEGRGRVRAAVSIDMVGWRRDRLGVRSLPRGFAHTADGPAPAWLEAAVREAGAAADVPLGAWLDPWREATRQATRPWSGSDDGAFLERGIPAVLLTGLDDAHAYPGYHGPDDVLAHVDPARLDAAARVTAAAAVEVAARAADAPRALGEPHLAVAGRTLGRAALLVVGLSGALVLGAAAVAAPRGRALLGLAGLALAAGAALASPLTVLVGTPLGYGLAAAAALERRLPRGIVLVAGAAPLALEGPVLREALAGHGSWTAGAAESIALGLLVVGAVLAGRTLLARPPAAAGEAPAP